METGTTQPAVEMRHLRLIAAIAEHGSMTAAGRFLNLTQPALSHQLRELETRLRSPLFVRTARRMVLTPAGQQLAQIALNVLPQVYSFERQVHDGEFTTTHGSVRIATECYTAYHWLPAVLQAFRSRWPHVDLRISAEHTASPVAALRDGALDLAILHRPVVDKRLKFERLFDDEMVLVTAPDHPLALKGFAPVESLANEHLFVYTSQGAPSTVLQDILAPASVMPAEITRIQLTEAIIELVAAGLGVAILASWSVAPAVRAGSVRTTRVGAKGYQRTWYAAVRSDDVTPAYQFDLVDLLRRNVAAGSVPGVSQQLRLS